MRGGQAGQKERGIGQRGGKAGGPILRAGHADRGYRSFDAT